jgi:hypothetical protein
VTANLLVQWKGGGISKYTAFVLVGLTLTVVDELHDLWLGQGLWWKMGLLILLGSLLTWSLNEQAGRIGLASLIAFVVSTLVDRVVYACLQSRPRWQRVGWSNLASGLVDSWLFAGLAFGGSPDLMWDQWVAKLAGTQFWSLILLMRQKRG